MRFCTLEIACNDNSKIMRMSNNELWYYWHSVISVNATPMQQNKLSCCRGCLPNYGFFASLPFRLLACSPLD